MEGAVCCRLWYIWSDFLDFHFKSSCHAGWHVPYRLAGCHTGMEYAIPVCRLACSIPGRIPYRVGDKWFARCQPVSIGAVLFCLWRFGLSHPQSTWFSWAFGLCCDSWVHVIGSLAYIWLLFLPFLQTWCLMVRCKLVSCSTVIHVITFCMVSAFYWCLIMDDASLGSIFQGPTSGECNLTFGLYQTAVYLLSPWRLVYMLVEPRHVTLMFGYAGCWRVFSACLSIHGSGSGATYICTGSSGGNLVVNVE